MRLLPRRTATLSAPPLISAPGDAVTISDVQRDGCMAQLTAATEGKESNLIWRDYFEGLFVPADRQSSAVA